MEKPIFPAESLIPRLTSTYFSPRIRVEAVIAVYDPDIPLCEREAAAAAVAEMLNKQILTLDPKAIRLQ